MKNKYTLTGRSKFMVAALVVAIILGAGGLYAYLHREKQPTYISTPAGKIDISPPTQQEKQDTEDYKTKLAEQQRNTETPTKKTVAPIIVDANQYGDTVEIRAFEPEVTESDGKCTFVFALENETLTRTVAATADATTTRCTNLSVPRAEFTTAGIWNITVSYTSSATMGSTVSKVTVK